MNVKKAIKKLQEWVGIIDSEYLTECDWSIASEHLNKRINEQEDRLASLKEELRSVEAKVRPLDIDVSSMRCAIEKVCLRINRTLGADKAAITKVEECEQLCEDTRMRLDVLKDELHSLQNKIPEGAGALSGSTAESVQNLSTQFETAIERINHSFDALYQRVATLEASSKEKATDLKAMQDNARAWDNTISKRLGFIETKQKVHHKDITEIQGALTTLRDETVQEVLTISGKIEALQVEKLEEKLQCSVDDHRTDLFKLSEVVAEMAEKIEHLQQSVDVCNGSLLEMQKYTILCASSKKPTDARKPIGDVEAIEDNPPGIDFCDAISGRSVRLVTRGAWAGWVCYQSDNHWIKLYEAAELAALGVIRLRLVETETQKPAEGEPKHFKFWDEARENLAERIERLETKQQCFMSTAMSGLDEVREAVLNRRVDVREQFRGVTSRLDTLEAEQRVTRTDISNLGESIQRLQNSKDVMGIVAIEADKNPCDTCEQPMNASTPKECPKVPGKPCPRYNNIEINWTVTEEVK